MSIPGTAWFSASLLLLLLPASQAVTRTTKYGDVEGKTFTLQDRLHAGVDIDTFLGIPFAKAPINELRFELPQEPEPWDDVFDATSLSTACMQIQGGTYWMLHNDWQDVGEDCLNLNIFAPSDLSGGPYPVLVHYHGGALYYGANLMYAGHFLAAQDVIVVVPNYRLAIFGFSYTGDDAIPGNMGLWDMQQSLIFIQENIANFGGDPDKVTIFGQSSGACAVGDLVLSPHLDGLFHQVGQMSGSELALWNYFGEIYESETYVRQIADGLDCPIDDTHEMTDCLRDVDAETLLSEGWLFNCSLLEGPCGGFRVVVDGEGGMLPQTPWVMRENGDFKKIPTMLGHCQNDAFTSVVNSPPLNRNQFERRLESIANLYSLVYADPAATEDALFHAMNFYYSPWPHINDGEANRYAYGKLLTDYWYGAFADEQARYHSPTADTYYFEFNYRSVVYDVTPEWAGVTHSTDLIYTFGHPFLRANPDIVAQMLSPDEPDYTEEDEDFSYFMMQIWTNFAKYGNPTEGGVTPPDFLGQPDDVIWDRYDNTNFSYIYLGSDAIETRHALNQHEFAFWREYFQWVSFGNDGRPEEF